MKHPEFESSERIIPPCKLAHVVLSSGRFGESVSWYKKVLGAQASHETDTFSFLTYDDEHHRVAIVSTPTFKPNEPDRIGINHFAFTYRSLAELLLTYERLARDNIVPQWSVNHGPTTSLYYRDPDCNRVELQVDNFETADECKAFFASEAFAENPVGVDFDPAEHLRKLRTGEATEAELKIRPRIGSRAIPSELR